MLKWAGILFVVMIIAGILGFVVDVAGWIAKVAFVICLIGFVVTMAMKYLGRKSG